MMAMAAVVGQLLNINDPEYIIEVADETWH